MGKEKIDPRKQRQARLERRADSALALYHLNLLGFIRMNIGFCPMEQTHRTEEETNALFDGACAL